MLKAERLRMQIARLRHQQHRRSFKRHAGAVKQFGLRFDEALAGIAGGGTGDAEDGGLVPRRRRGCGATAASRCPAAYRGGMSSICHRALRLLSLQWGTAEGRRVW